MAFNDSTAQDIQMIGQSVSDALNVATQMYGVVYELKKERERKNERDAALSYQRAIDERDRKERAKKFAISTRMQDYLNRMEKRRFGRESLGMFGSTQKMGNLSGIWGR